MLNRSERPNAMNREQTQAFVKEFAPRLEISVAERYKLVRLIFKQLALTDEQLEFLVGRVDLQGSTVNATASLIDCFTTLSPITDQQFLAAARNVNL
jgi:hypothetical protein